jgi:sodium-dependent dicarboxylate transporter 2/3/5
LLLGPVAFLVVLLMPIGGLAPDAHRLAAVVVWIVTWWVTEPVPIPVTALLVPVLLVVLRIATVRDALAPFGDPVIYLFLGSFVLAAAMSRHGLDRRLAFRILASPLVGSSTHRLVAAFAVLATGLSMWLSNTATTAMLYPIALGVLAALSRLLEREQGRPVDLTRLRFGAALMLACAYGASIGGVATPVGSPPNLIALGQLETLAATRIPFFHWMLLGVPVTAVMLLVLLVVLRVLLPPEVRTIPGGTSFIAEERARLGPLTRGERNVVAVFALTVFLWVLPGLVGLAGGEGGLASTLADLLPESVVALGAVLLLFLLPVDWRQRQFTLTWGEAVRVDWGTLLLFGGGLSLGGAMFKTGLAASFGRALTTATGADSVVALAFLFTTVGILLTELTSNTATATMLVPLAVASARAVGVDPVAPALACALGCSMAFMLPVATPPNAIVYGSGCVAITTMVRVGSRLVVAAALLIPLVVLLLAGVVAG